MIRNLLSIFVLTAIVWGNVAYSQPKILRELKTIHSSEKYILSNWNSKNGLPQNSVNSIVQDKNGFIWIGTFDGLARFDGLNFRLFSVKEFPELKSNRILKLFVDANNILWITNELGRLIIFDGKKFKDVTPKFKSSFIDILGFENGPAGTVYLNTLNRLFIYNKGSVRIINLNSELNPSSKDSTNTISYLGGDTLLVGQEFQISLLYKEKKINSVAVPPGTIIQCFKNKLGYWFLRGPFLHYSKTFSGLSTAKIIDPSLRFTTVFNAGSYVVASTYEGAVYIVTLNGPEKIAEISGSPIFIKSLFVGNENNIWFGSDIAGLYCARKKFLYALDKSFGIIQPNTYPILTASDGSIWIGQNAGLQRIVQNKIINYPSSPDGLKNACVWGLAEDNKKNIWIGVNGYGLFKYNGKNFEDYTGQITARTGIFIYSVFHDKKDRIWVGSANCITKYENGVFSFYNPTPEEKNIFRNFIEDDKGIIWIASEQGLLKLENDKFSRITSINAKLARSLYIDKKNRLWIGTYGNGLWIKEGDRFVSISKSAGLFSDIISATAEDGKGNFWFTSNNGIFRVRESEINNFLSRKNSSVTSLSYGEEQGLENVEFNGGCQPNWMRDKEGNLWFPSMNGPVVLDVNSINDRIIPANVHIESLALQDTTFYPGDEISIPSSDSRFTISFSTPSFSSPRNIRFKYILSGIDKDWIDLGNQRSITFPKLPYGDYEFLVLATDSYGNWNTVPASIKFSIKSKFYETPLFYLLIMLVLLFVIVLVVFRKLQTDKNIQYRLEKTVSERTAYLMMAKDEAERSVEEEKILRSKTEEENRQKNELLRIVSHDLKNPVSAIQGFVEMLLEDGSLNEEDKSIVIMIDEAGQRLKELITQLLNFSRFEGENFSIFKSSIKVQDEVGKIVERFKTTAGKKGQTIITDFHVSGAVISVDSILFSQIVENLISNAIKYSLPGKEIIVTLREDEDKVFIIVKDFGQGFSEADKQNMFKPFIKLSSLPTAGELSTGLGLTIVKKFVELNEGSLRLESQKGIGSVFTIEFNKV